MTLKLNLGCGNDIREGYTNIDIRKTHPDVLQCPIEILHFEDNSVDEILAIDVMEHLPYIAHDRMFMRFYGWLKPNGKLIIEVPDLQKISRALAQEDDVLKSEELIKKIYGGQGYSENHHQWGFTKDTLKSALKLCGFLVEEKECWEWNIRIVATKPEVTK